MLKKILLGICIGGSSSLFSVYAATAAECLKDCVRNKSIAREDLQKCQAGCKDGAESISVSTSAANADVTDRSKRRKSNPNTN
ncbi:MAG: hypothetical protein ACRCYZ_01350 [Alphaproteobacteria bacterium]